MEFDTAVAPGWFSLTGKPAALDRDQLVVDHQQMVYRIAYSVLRNPHDAADAAQEAFLRVFKAAGKLAGVTDQKAWVARIAWNAAHDARRKTRAVQAETPVEELVRGVATLRHAGRSPEEIAAGSQMQRLLARLIETLPESLKQPLQLSTVEDLDHREIAAALGITEAAVRARLFQARQKLREKLENIL